MAIDATSESRRSTSACIASSAAGSVGGPRRTAGVVRNVHVLGPSGRAATATGRPKASSARQINFVLSHFPLFLKKRNR